MHYTPGRLHFAEGFFLGILAASTFLIPQALIPDAITRWERGAWGEQSTARALRKLDRRAWTSRHDLATGWCNTNRDHIVVGPAVYLLDSKLLHDKVVVEEDGLHLRNLDTESDSPLSYTRRMQAASRAVGRELSQSVGFPVHVNPVIVIWSWFPAGVHWEEDVAYVAGEHIATWISQRPADLLTAEKQVAVKTWLKELPRA